jgi:hypothetical protein
MGTVLFLVSSLALALPPVGGTSLSSSSSSSSAAGVEVLGGSTLVAPGALAPLEITLKVPPGFTVYRDMVEVKVTQARGLSLGPPSLPPGLSAPDPAAPGQTRELYDFDAVVQIPLLKPAPTGTWAVELDVRYQSCAGSVCLMPRTEQVITVLQVGAPQAGG